MVHVSGVVNMAMKWYGHFGKIGIASLNVVLFWLVGICSIENVFKNCSFCCGCFQGSLNKASSFLIVEYLTLSNCIAGVSSNE